MNKSAKDSGLHNVEVDARGVPLLPPESPLEMPVASLDSHPPAPRVLPGAPRGIAWRRLWVFGGTAALTGYAVYQLWWALRPGGVGVLESLSLLLFAALFIWVAQSFVSALAGFALIVHGYRRPGRLGLIEGASLPQLTRRTALLAPTYNEEPERLMAGLQAVYESLASTGRLEHFDLFVLSDSTRPEIRARERDAFDALRERTGGQVRLFYRHRSENTERKAGNIAEWVRRFGAAYPHFLILDADSLMTGKCLVRLARAMERHPRVALIQTLPTVVNGNTMFARMQQFAGRVYGQVLAVGNAWWHGTEGNYWGHNAILRTRAFAACAGLPKLRGPRPFGGHVLSHDFVEAALLRRDGWAVHLVPNLGGSFEEGPPSLTDMLIRDRRWCQGNLQHGGVLPGRGLHWVGRWHMLTGIGHYLTAPLWAMLIVIGLLLTAAGGAFAPGQWDGPAGAERFLLVFGLTVALLLGPKLLGFTLAFFDPWARRSCGGALRMLASMLVETALTTLLAPITMYVQSRGVAEVLAGRDSGWESQRRDDGTLPWPVLMRRYAGVTACGLVGAVCAWLVSPALALWMSPVLVGMVLSAPLVALTTGPRVSAWVRGVGLFRTAEESAPPPVLVRAQQLRAGIAGQAPERLPDEVEVAAATSSEPAYARD